MITDDLEDLLKELSEPVYRNTVRKVSVTRDGLSPFCRGITDLSNSLWATVIWSLQIHKRFPPPIP